MTLRLALASIATCAYVLLAAMVSGCGLGSAADPDVPVDSGGPLVSTGGRIAFTRATEFEGANIESEVYAVNVDGTDEARLTDSPGLDAFPSWSPDGRRIAFATDRGGNWEIYAMNADGSGKRRLTRTPGTDESTPAWSPDGEKIAYGTDVIGNFPAIWVMDQDGSARRQLTGGSWPGWSPDGERIAYTVYSSSGAGKLVTMEADGTGQQRLGGSLAERLTGNADGEEPAWSPSGDRIAFAAEHLGDWEIYAMDPDGSDRTRLTDIPGHDHWPPTWSPDGTRMAFTHDGAEGGPGEIYVMNADGSGLTRLTNDTAEDAFPAWRP